MCTFNIVAKLQVIIRTDSSFGKIASKTKLGKYIRFLFFFYLWLDYHFVIMVMFRNKTVFFEKKIVSNC